MYAHACHFVASARLVEALLRRPDLPGPILAYAHFADALALLCAGRPALPKDRFEQALAAHGQAVESGWFDPIAKLWKCHAHLLTGQFLAA
jgi:hypothetical protein